MSVTTSYIYTENGVDKNGNSAADGGVFKFYGWSGPFKWIITFPTPIENVTEVDLSVIPGNIRNTTVNFGGRLRFFIFDETDTVIHSSNSDYIAKSSSITVASIGAFTLTGQTVSSIQVWGWSGSGPNFTISDIVEGVTTYNITTTAPVPGISAEMYTHLADLTWDSVSGATTYRVTQQQDGGTETDVITDSTDLTGTVFVENGSTYVFSLYVDSDITSTAVTATVTPSVVSEASVTLLSARLSNDFTLLDENAIIEIEDHISSSLTHLDTVNTRVSTGTGETKFESTYLGPSEITSVDEGSYMFSFTDATGAGQTTTMVTPDAVSNEITYDNINSEITFDGTNYAAGTSFIIGGMRAIVYDVV